MKTSIRNKKGFTIVELVIVIAVIAILAAVLIPTFANLVEKANLSADEQAVRQMNTALKIYEAENGKPETVGEAKTALYTNGINTDTMTPVTQGYAFYWNPTDNLVVLVGEGKATAEDDWEILTSSGYGVLKETADAADIKSAIESSSTKEPAFIRLTADTSIVSDETKAGNEIVVGEGKSVTIDLNGKTLTINNRFFVKAGGSLTVKNGTVNSSERAFKNDNSSLVLDGVTVNVTGDPLNNGAAIFVIGISDTSIVDCAITTSNGYAFATNSSEDENDGARISIINSTLETSDSGNGDHAYAAVNINIGATVVIENCSSIKGVSHGAFLRGCNAIIKNSTFSHTGNSDTAWIPNGSTGKSADLVLASGNNTENQFNGYIATATYKCTNVEAKTVIVHEPEGGKVTVSGDIKVTHTCHLGKDEKCKGSDETCGKQQ